MHFIEWHSAKTNVAAGGSRLRLHTPDFDIFPTYDDGESHRRSMSD